MNPTLFPQNKTVKFNTDTKVHHVQAELSYRAATNIELCSIHNTTVLNKSRDIFITQRKQISALTHKLLWHSALTFSYIIS